MGVETEYDDDDVAERVKAALSQVAGDRSNQSVIIDNGKYMAAIVVLSLIAGVSGAVAWWAATSYREDSLEIQDEYQKERNHVIELEGNQKSQAEEIHDLQRQLRQLGART